MKATDFVYELPETSIAQSAIEPRHQSRLLDTRDLSDHNFIELPSLLMPGDLVVVNKTRVRHARLRGVRRGTGGAVEMLLLERYDDGTWEALARPTRRLRAGVEIDLDEFTATLVDDPSDGKIRVRLSATDDEAAVAVSGEMPLPPYFRGELVDPERYQTMFASTPGSAAAPTAGLHFTTDVVDGLVARDIDIVEVDLHVSLDTFRPMTAEDIEDHVMHSEWCSIGEPTAQAIASTRAAGGRIVAVGTTVVRTLETFADGNGAVDSGERRTDLFITPGYDFGVVDVLITNFHMPGSTLLVLLASFMGPSWREAYATAIDRGYRFLSFGDAMLAARSS